MKKKKFDCVEMKHDIQKKIAEETKTMTDKEKQLFYQNKLLSDPILSKLNQLKLIRV